MVCKVPCPVFKVHTSDEGDTVIADITIITENSSAVNIVFAKIVIKSYKNNKNIKIDSED